MALGVRLILVQQYTSNYSECVMLLLEISRIINRARGVFEDVQITLG